jgi:hypothetical protein
MKYPAVFLALSAGLAAPATAQPWSETYSGPGRAYWEVDEPVTADEWVDVRLCWEGNSFPYHWNWKKNRLIDLREGDAQGKCYAMSVRFREPTERTLSFRGTSPTNVWNASRRFVVRWLPFEDATGKFRIRSVVRKNGRQVGPARTIILTRAQVRSPSGRVTASAPRNKKVVCSSVREHATGRRVSANGRTLLRRCYRV